MLIHKDLLKAVGCASTDSAQYRLNGINFRRIGENIRAETTDGRTLCIIERKEEDAEEYPINGCSIEHREESFILPSATIKKIDKNVAKKPRKPVLENFLVDETKLPGKTTIGMVDDDIDTIDISTHMVDGIFPDVEAITDKYREGNEIQAEFMVNPYYLVQALNTLMAITGKTKKDWQDRSNNVAVRVKVKDKETPVEFTFEEKDKEQTTRVYVCPLVTK